MAAPSPGGLLRDQFPIFRQQTYLNTCSLGALSTQSRSRLSEYLELWEARGAAAWYDVWLPVLDQLRARYAGLIGADPQEISLHPSISAAIAAVAEALDYRTRPRVLTTSLDFPTLAYQWLARKSEGVELTVVESPDGLEVPLEVVDPAIDNKTALLATSQVFFRTGAIQEIAPLAELCHARGARLLVDGYQAVGQIPVDVKAMGVDFYCGGGLKWLLGGSGITFLYADGERVADLQPRLTGWFAHQDPFAFEPRTLVRRTDARRFEAGTPSMASVYTQLGGLDVLEELGLARILEVTAALRDDLIERATEMGLRPQVARMARHRSAIVSIPSRDPGKDVRRLAEARIITDARPGHVRLSPYFYNIVDDHRAALELLACDTSR